MASTVKCIGIVGINGYPVDVEVKIIAGMAIMSIVGLGDQAVKEARDRIESAFDQMGAIFPKKKIIVNLSPSDIKKSGTYFDLPMVIGILLESGQLEPNREDLERTIFLGEVGLRGDLKTFHGVLPMVIAAKQNGFHRLVLPKSSLREASLVSGLEILGFDTLEEVTQWIEKRSTVSCLESQSLDSLKNKNSEHLNYSDVRGHNELLHFVTAAAAGGHNLLLVGPPGCGKSMIAKRLPSILPELSEEELLEVLAIQSVTGLLMNSGISYIRPFRSPHYNTSPNAIIGGGANAKPGEISLAHNGVLFLDELPEFTRQTLEALRQPLEDRVVTVARVKQTNTYPAEFMLVAAMNPCPCGYSGDNRCRCTPYEIRRYRQRISGPILERIDIQKYMGKYDFLAAPTDSSFSSETLKGQVEKARHIQKNRFASAPHIRTNAQMDVQAIEQFCQLDQESQNLLNKAYERHGFSARIYHKLLRLARTFADLEACTDINKHHIVSSLMARDLDRDPGEQAVSNPRYI